MNPVLLFVILTSPIQVQDKTGDSASHTRLGIIDVRAGRVEKGIENLDRAIEGDSKNTLAYLWRGRGRSSVGQFKEAIEDFTKVIELEPDDAAAYVERADAKRQLRDEEGAKADMDKAMDLQPSLKDDPKEIEVVKPPEGPIRRSKEITLTDMMGKLIDLPPLEFTAEKYYQLALARLNQGSFYTEAIRYLNKAIELDPKFARAYSKRGAAKLGAGRWREALPDLDRALAMNPKDAESLMNRSFALYKLARYREAYADANRAIKINPNLSQAYVSRASARRMLAGSDFKKVPEIYEDLKKAAVLLPMKTARDFHELGGIKLMLTDFQGAIEAYTRAIELNPSFAEAYGNRGFVRAKLRDYEGAMKDYDSAVQIDPSFKPMIQKLKHEAKEKMRK